MVYILINNTHQGNKDGILMVSTNKEEVDGFKERNDEQNVWKILSYSL